MAEDTFVCGKGSCIPRFLVILRCGRKRERRTLYANGLAGGKAGF